MQERNPLDRKRHWHKTSKLPKARKMAMRLVLADNRLDYV